MKLLSVLILSICCTLTSLAQDDIVGSYWTPDKDGKIKVYKVGDIVYAKLTWIKDMASQQSKKPNGESTLGSILLTGFVKKKDNLWSDGYIVDPTKEKKYSGKLWLDENNNLVARGFIGIALLGKTVVFERIK
ncbi:MAG: DUF2147 domain-containing protein [Crocinitomicaceae bacterium]|nr:DUF2147 domain-containing protein [Crocinitomicaceae bacterium]